MDTQSIADDLTDADPDCAVGTLKDQEPAVIEGVLATRESQHSAAEVA